MVKINCKSFCYFWQAGLWFLQFLYSRESMLVVREVGWKGKENGDGMAVWRGEW